jgi:hypothetical protein
MLSRIPSLNAPLSWESCLGSGLAKAS